MPKKIYTVRFRQAFVEEWDGSDGTFLDHCARFGVPRQTGYEWIDRVTEGGLSALETRSSAPHSCPHATSDEVIAAIVASRKLHPTWGPRKLRPWLLDQDPTLELPVASTMGDILKRLGLVPKRRRRRRTPRFTEQFAKAGAPNDVWTADFKGQFRLGDGTRCYPLTIADAFSAATSCAATAMGRRTARREPVSSRRSASTACRR